MPFKNLGTYPSDPNPDGYTPNPPRYVSGCPMPNTAVFPGCNARIVLVFANTGQFDYQGLACSWRQFPLRLAYGITVHKSQSLTLSKAVMNLATK